MNTLLGPWLHLSSSGTSLLQGTAWPGEAPSSGEDKTTPTPSHTPHPPSPSTITVRTQRGNTKPSPNENNPWQYKPCWNDFIQYCQQKHESCLLILLLFVSSTTASDLKSFLENVGAGCSPQMILFPAISCPSTVSAEVHLGMSLLLAEMKDSRKGSAQVSSVCV